VFSLFIPASTEYKAKARLTFFTIQPILTLRIRDFVTAHGRAGQQEIAADFDRFFGSFGAGLH
jgi:hypothetical protein